MIVKVQVTGGTAEISNKEGEVLAREGVYGPLRARLGDCGGGFFQADEVDILGASVLELGERVPDPGWR